MIFSLSMITGVFTKILLLKTYQMIFEQRNLLIDWLLDNKYLIYKTLLLFYFYV